ncbi:MAG: NPCBM/NEW2 domain-containing protein [Tepidisphaeraceae bacterium]|jgi:hypothetical protein
MRFPPTFSRTGLGPVLLLLTIAPSVPASPWKITNSQFQSQSVDLQSIDQDGLHLTAQPTTMPWSDILEISHPAPAPPAGGKFVAFLTTSDHLSGDPEGITGDQLQWNAPGLGAIQLPEAKLAAICRAGSAAPEGLDQVRTDDQVLLANGDRTHGIITQIDAIGVTIQTDAATPTLPWDSVSAVLISSTPTVAKNDRVFRVRFGDDSSITASTVALAGDQLSISFDGKTTRTIDDSLVAAIEQINGPVSWLTSRTPSVNIYNPYFTEDFPTKFDRTVDGRPIREKYPDFHHGIGCHSYSKLVYDLDGTYTVFRTQFAIDSDSPLADVTARILLDDKVAWEMANVKAGRIYPVVQVPLGAAKHVGLEVDFGENYATEGRFVWLDPALVAH